MPATPVDAASPASNASNAIFCKTKMCKFYMVGRCTRNSACKFAHGAAELEPLPNLHRTKMCPALCTTGRCDRGAACTFAHKASELRGRRKGAARANTQGTTAAACASATVVASPMTTTTPTTQAPIRTPCVLTGVSVMLVQVAPLQYPVPEVQAADLEADAESDLSDVDLDFTAPSCKPSGGWSRQTTEEGPEELSEDEFSRQNSDESAWEQESAWGLEEEEEEVVQDQRQVEETTPRQREASPRGEAFSSRGLVVKNTFLHFEDPELLPLPALRRVSSTGGCAVRGL